MGVYDAESTWVWLWWRREGLAIRRLRDSEPAPGADATGRVSVGDRKQRGERLPGCLAGMQGLLSPNRDQSRVGHSVWDGVTVG